MAAKMSDFNRRPRRLIPCRRANSRNSATVDDMFTPLNDGAVCVAFKLKALEKAQGAKMFGERM